jgi:HPt (histidine-containing phosphotransfer) domain-containing protein
MTGSAGPAEEPVLDAEVIAGLRELSDEDGPDILVELVEMYLGDTPPRLVALREAVGQSDAEAVKQIAHSVKGSSGNLGAQRMARLCAELETAGTNRDLARATRLLRRIEAEFGRASEALKGVAPS